MGRTSIIVVLAVVTACATGGRERRPAFGPTPAELSELLADFERAMNAKQLDEARRVLTALESGIEQAPVSTITHPDYMRISAGVDQARDALEAARGGASFSGWLASARSAIALADRALAEMDDGVTAERFVALERAAKRVENLVVAGEAYQTETEYTEVAGELEERLVMCAERVESVRWQVAATEAVAGPLGDARRAEQALTAGPDRERQLVGTMVAGFKSCAAVALLHAGKPGASDAPLVTPYGQLAIDEVRELCTERAGQATARLAGLAETAAAVDAVQVIDVAEVDEVAPVSASVTGWQALVADVRADHEFAQRELRRAEGAGHRAEVVVALANALTALLRCASRAEHLIAGAPAADVDAVTEMATRCRREAARARLQLDRE